MAEFKTIDAMFEEFVAAVYPDPPAVGSGQRLQVRDAFHAGARSLYSAMMDAAISSLSVERFALHVMEQFDAFHKEVAARRDDGPEEDDPAKRAMLELRRALNESDAMTVLPDGVPADVVPFPAPVIGFRSDTKPKPGATREVCRLCGGAVWYSEKGRKMLADRAAAKLITLPLCNQCASTRTAEMVEMLGVEWRANANASRPTE